MLRHHCSLKASPRFHQSFCASPFSIPGTSSELHIVMTHPVCFGLWQFFCLSFFPIDIEKFGLSILPPVFPVWAAGIFPHHWLRLGRMSPRHGTHCRVTAGAREWFNMPYDWWWKTRLLDEVEFPSFLHRNMLFFLFGCESNTSTGGIYSIF